MKYAKEYEKIKNRQGKMTLAEAVEEMERFWLKRGYQQIRRRSWDELTTVYINDPRERVSLNDAIASDWELYV